MGSPQGVSKGAREDPVTVYDRESSQVVEMEAMPGAEYDIWRWQHDSESGKSWSERRRTYPWTDDYALRGDLRRRGCHSPLIAQVSSRCWSR